jgi:hypothetical protein
VVSSAQCVNGAGTFPKARNDDGQRPRQSEGPDAGNARKGSDNELPKLQRGPGSPSSVKMRFVMRRDGPLEFQCLKMVLLGFEEEELHAKEGGEARGRGYGS